MVVLMAWRNRVLAVGGVLGLLAVSPAGARLAGPPLGTTESAQSGARKTIDMVAERFLFIPSEVTVDAGTTLELRLSSEDTDHGFRIIGTDVHVVIPKRGRGEVVAVFEAKEPGHYTFECSQICGAGHSFMRGTIRVRPGTPRADAPAAGARR
jgi:cytochrome c oxidase subunit II